MLLYLPGHYRPDISYGVVQVARFVFCPECPREGARTLVDSYLPRTQRNDLIIDPTRDLNTGAYCDVNFKIVPISNYRHHNTYVRRSYVKLR